jgi:acyl-coenzyme A synthetase/AMP-(fatty) acid ligase
MWNGCCLFTPISFDVSAQEILSAFSNGKTLFVCPDDTRRDPANFTEHEINELFAPTLVIGTMCEIMHENWHNTTYLDHIVQAGETLILNETLSYFFGFSGRTQLDNHYGPTETHVASSYIFARSIEQWPSLAPIGRPI